MDRRRRLTAILLPIILGMLLMALMAARALARGGGGCLEEGTLIETPSGPVPIERLVPGDWVLSGAGGLARVLAVLRVGAEEYLELSVGGRVLRVTPEHPVAVGAGSFRVAAALRAGEPLGVWSHEGLGSRPLGAVRRVKAERPAYNLLVSPVGTFLANGVLVHNKGCFLPDTPVLRADGASVPISEVAPGDQLLAFTPQGGIVRAAVRNVVATEADEYAVVTTERAVLCVTQDHPFFVGEGTFRTLDALKSGDAILAFDGSGLSRQTIADIRRVRATVRVYNLQTDAPHTFFACGIAVHNKGGGCFPARTRIQTPSGASAIEGLRAGDEVLSLDSRGRTVRTLVESVHVAQSLVLVLRTDSGLLRTTAEHPLGLPGGSYRAAGTLGTGDRLLRWQEGHVFAATILGCERTAELHPVYDLSVGPPHAFIADGFVVHNKGGGFGGGGGGRGGSFGGDGWVAIIVFGIFIAILLRAMRAKGRQDEDLDYVYSASAVARKADKTRKLLEFIARTDAAFTPERLTGTARATFLKLQECWQARDYGPMQPLLMPDLYHQHCAQIRGMVRNHEINVIASLHVERIEIVHVHYTNKGDDREFVALITARARDHYVDDRTREFLRGDPSPARFQEFWTFQLQGGRWLLREIEQTRESDALKRENFFEPFTDHGLKGVYAGADGGEGPAGPWREGGVDIKGTRIERMLNFLVQTDRLWDREAMEATARRVFMQVMLAQEAGDPSAIRPDDFFPAAAEALRSEILRRRENGLALELRNLCVRKVDLVLIRNFTDRSKDEFTVCISAHAQQIVRRGGEVVTQQAYVAPFTQFWTFGRQDNRWKLKQVLPPERGHRLVAQENIDQESSPGQLQWYYKQPRAV